MADFRSKLDPVLYYLHLYVKPEQRRCILGSLLYAEMENALVAAGATRLRSSVWDTYPEGLGFARRRGFVERAYQLSMSLDLAAFDDRPYQAIKTHALRYAHEQLGVSQVRTHHNSQNQPMIAIDL